MPLEWLFGKKKTPAEMLRQNQRALNKAMRDLDRERQKMEQQEKKIIADIQKMAKKGEMVCSLFTITCICKHRILNMNMFTFYKNAMFNVFIKDAVRIMAKDLVRTRRYVKKFIMMRANIQAVSLKIQTLKANDAMAQAMRGVTKAMSAMNKQVGFVVNWIDLSSYKS